MRGVREPAVLAAMGKVRPVIPVGASPREQRLVRVVRGAADDHATEDLGDVAFVALIGVQGWREAEAVE